MTIDNINEKIIFKSVAKPQNSSKQIGRWLLIMFTLGLLYYFYSLWKITGLLNVLILFIFIILFIVALYGLIYNLFIHDRKNKNYLYLLTEKHLIIAKDNIIIRNEEIASFNSVQICREKNNYGDLIFLNINFDNILSNVFPKQNKMELLGVENLREMVNLLLAINPDIYISDDKIKIKNNL